MNNNTIEFEKMENVFAEVQFGKENINLANGRC